MVEQLTGDLSPAEVALPSSPTRYLRLPIHAQLYCLQCVPGAPSPEYLAVGDGDFNGAFHMLQTLDLAESSSRSPEPVWVQPLTERSRFDVFLAQKWLITHITLAS